MERVLVVEDSAVDRRIVTAALARKNLQVLAESTVSGAIAALSRESFALVLLDYRLPDGTGADVYRWLCRWSEEMCNRSIVITGECPATVRDAFGGETPILAKPISLPELFDTIEGTLAQADA